MIFYVDEKLVFHVIEVRPDLPEKEQIVSTLDSYEDAYKLAAEYHRNPLMDFSYYVKKQVLKR